MLALKNDDKIFDTLFVFMVKSDDRAEDEIILLDLEENLNLYFVKKLKKLVFVLIDSLCELLLKKLLKNNTDIFQDEKIILTILMSDLEEKLLHLRLKRMIS